MATTVPRKDAVSTFGEAFDWLKRNPVLIGLFFVLGVVDAIGEEVPLFSLLGVLLVLYFGGIAHLFARDELAGTAPDLAAASSRVVGRMLSLIGIFIVYTILVAVGLLLLILPGIYLLLRLSLAFPACVIDEQNAFESLSTSWEVAHGNLFKLLGISILAILAYLAAAIIAAIIAAAGGAGAFAIVIVVSAVVSAVVQPTVEMAYARIYLENRHTDPEDDSAVSPGSSAGRESVRDERDDWDDESTRDDRSGHGWDRRDDGR